MPRAEHFFATPVTLAVLRPMCEGCHYWRESEQGNCKLVRAMLGLATGDYLPDAIQPAPGEQLGLFGTTERRPYCERRTAPIPKKPPSAKTVVLPGQVAMFAESS